MLMREVLLVWMILMSDQSVMALSLLQARWSNSTLNKIYQIKKLVIE